MRILVWPMAMAGLLLASCAASPLKISQSGTSPAPRTPASPGYTPDPRVTAADKRAKELGYHMELRHDVQFYCRTVAPLGSRLTQKECLTVDTMAEAAQITEENQATLRQSRACQGGGCSAN
jgi:hypothetical protein